MSEYRRQATRTSVCQYKQTKTIKKFLIIYARLSDMKKIDKDFFHTHLDICFDNCFYLTLSLLPQMTNTNT